jgi:hypothetical protein
MKKNRGHETIQVIIHIYMEMSQGNSLHSYLKQEKMPFFFSFFFYEIREQEGRTGPAREVPVGGVNVRKRVLEGEYGVNIVYTCM